MNMHYDMLKKEQVIQEKLSPHTSHKQKKSTATVLIN